MYRLSFDVRIEPHQEGWSVGEETDGRQCLVGAVKVVDGESDLLEIVLALHSSCGFSCGLYGGQEECDEHADDGDDDEQFDESEASQGGGAFVYRARIGRYGIRISRTGLC